MAKNPIFTGFLKDSSLHIPGNAGYIEQRTGVKWEEVRAELLKDPETAQAVKDLEPEYEIIQEIIEARIKQGLTQEDSSKCIDKSNTREYYNSERVRAAKQHANA